MFKIPADIQHIIEKIHRNGEEAYLVGGCVRDMLMGITPHDYDITTSALPKEITSIFHKTVPTGIKHGTVTVITGECTAEVTTYRTEGGYMDSRHPENIVFVKSLKEDLARRDFTINAMAYNNEEGLQDYFGGQEDIENKILRAVGDPMVRFKEDALRILRLFRFSATLGFGVEEKTLNAAIENAETLKNISGERIREELFKALAGENIEALKPLTDTGVLQFIGICHSPNYKKVQILREDTVLAFFAFLYSARADMEKALTKLRVSNDIKHTIHALHQLFQMPFPHTKQEIKEMLYKTDEEIVKKYLKVYNIFFGMDIAKTQALLDEIIKNKEPYRIKHLKIGGHDLLKLGITGEALGEALVRLRKYVIDNPKMNKRRNLIQKLKEFYRN